MVKTINADTLREWLTSRKTVTLLDIRKPEDRNQWSIPGSVHVDAYDALREGNAGPLADVDFPRDTPVVTICNMGQTSQLAAEALRARGYEASSLEGGMKAWSLAWNTAKVPLDNSPRVIQVRRTGKGCLSYVIASSGDALVIDASLSPDVYLDIVAQFGARVRYVLDTHIHADHLSRSRLLAEEAGATLLLPRQGRVHFPFTAIEPDSQIVGGAATLSPLHTPGHTLESISLVLNGVAIFTGDTLFVSGVGRPDLDANAEATRERARLLYRSLQQVFTLGSGILVLPAHTGEPVAFDGRPVTARLGDVAERLQDWLTSEDAFVKRIVERVPPTPPNYTRIVELNEAGGMPEGDPTDLEAGANRCAIS